MRIVTVVLVAFIAGCSGSGPRAPSADDPANPKAAESAWQAPADRLSGPVEPIEGEKPPEGGTWTCPMHPEVTSSSPGTCPKCGMDLAPAHKEHEHK